MSESENTATSSEAMSDMAWNGHRKRMLKEAGIDPEELDA